MQVTSIGLALVLANDVVDDLSLAVGKQLLEDAAFEPAKPFLALRLPRAK